MALPDHTDVDLTDEQRANLTKLADYLVTLPRDYPDFAMEVYSNDGNGYGCDVAHVAVCGTAACAAGHGPRAGIDPEEGENWNSYSYRAFVKRGLGWAWCFDEIWSEVDNTAHGAAARIRYMLQNGLPSDHYDQRWGDAPLSYSVEPVSA